MPEQFLHGVEVVEIDDGIRPIRTVKSSIIGIVGTAPDAPVADWPADAPVFCTGPRQAATLGDAGTLKDAYEAIYAQGAKAVIMVRVDEGVDADATLANVVGDATQMTGVFALLQAETAVHYTPRILAAPGFTSTRPGNAKNPAAAALETVATKLRSIVYVDGPNTTEADAITYRGDFGLDRIIPCDPHVKVFDTVTATNVVRPLSAFACGATAFRDNERGFWWSPSNSLLAGVVGTARPISFSLSDPDTEANRLNENEVMTVIHKDGYRLWGNRTASADPLWAFISVRRTADLIYDSIEQAHLWAMDRPFSAQLIKDIEGGVNAYLRRLTALGAILGGKAFFDPELNTETTLKDGKLFLDFDFEPPAPLEHLIFRAHREGAYYDELVAEVAAV